MNALKWNKTYSHLLCVIFCSSGALTMVWTVNTPRCCLYRQASKSFHCLGSGTLLSMSTHLPPLQLCLMIWAGLKSVRGAMFREMESRVTMETRLQVPPYSGILNLFLWESYNEPDRHQKLQSIPAGSCENEAVTFLCSRIRLPRLLLRLWRCMCCYATICLSVSHVKVQTQ